MNPLTVVIFGATGDLFRKKLAKVFFDIYDRKILPEDTEIIGISRKPLSDQEFRQKIKEILNKDSLTEREEKFFSKIFYLSGDIKDQETFNEIGKIFVARDEKINKCSNKLFYLAVFPELYEELFRMIARSGLTVPCAPQFGKDDGWIKIFVEKPFGENAEKAESLDNLLGKLFSEDQIFRVDHYLAKETMQNILFFRFANSLFEALWSKKHIKSVAIKIFEEHRVTERGAFYDKIGALKDVGQNHLLSLLSLVAMDMPASLSGNAIRKEREKILASVKSKGHVVRGQYKGYKAEGGVGENSETETYFKAELTIENERWRGVSFEIEHGKAFSKTDAFIEITYAEKSGDELFIGAPNKLIFQIQPSEKIEIEFFAKKPGFESLALEKQFLTFSYKEGGISPFIYPYEKLLSDGLKGDQTLFVSTGETKEAWRIVDSIEGHMKKEHLQIYEKGINPSEISQ